PPPQPSPAAPPPAPGAVPPFPRPGVVPASVTLPRPIGHDGITYSGTHAGWLGPRHDPLELKAAFRSRDDSFALDPAADVSTGRLAGRQSLLSRIEAAERRMQKRSDTAGLSAFHEPPMR